MSTTGKNGNTIISADSHVFEPVNLWDTRLDKKYRERGPRFVVDWQGKGGTWFVCEGAQPRSIDSIAAAGVPKEDLVKFKNMSFKDLRPGGYDPGRFVNALMPDLAAPDQKVAGLHVFTFNEIEPTERWRQEMLARLN